MASYTDAPEPVLLPKGDQGQSLQTDTVHTKLLEPYLAPGAQVVAGAAADQVEGLKEHKTTVQEYPWLQRKNEPLPTKESLIEKEMKEYVRKPEAIPAPEFDPKRVEELRTKFEKGVSDLVPEQDRALLKQLRDGALDGNPASIQEAFKALKDDPKKLRAMVDELNNEFSSVDSKVRFGLTDDNRLLLSADDKNGIVVSDKGVEAAAVTRASDGHIHLSQGQDKSSPVDDVIKAVHNDLGTDNETYSLYKLGNEPPSWIPKSPFRLPHIKPSEIWDRTPGDSIQDLDIKPIYPNK